VRLAIDIFFLVVTCLTIHSGVRPVDKAKIDDSHCFLAFQLLNQNRKNAFDAILKR